MVSNTEKKIYCNQLLKVIKEISDLLKAAGKDPSEYQGLEKAKNIAKNADFAGFKNIARYLDDDFRKIYDNRASTVELETKMEEAYSILDQFLPS